MNLGTVLSLVRNLSAQEKDLHHRAAEATQKNAQLAKDCHVLASQEVPQAERQSSLHVRDSVVHETERDKEEREETAMAAQYKEAEMKLNKVQVRLD